MIHGLTNIEFIDDETLAVTYAGGNEILRFTINHDRLVELARAAAIRTFTDEECSTYGIDPCPSLEEIKVG